MVPRRVSRFITSLDKRDLGQSKYSQREKTKEIKREIVTSEKPHRGLDFNTARAIGESGPQESEPKDVGLVFPKPGLSPV